MNCETYLSMLETLPVEELSYGSAREHALTCRDCDRITRVVAERERNMAMAFGDVNLSIPAAEMAAHARLTSRRRRIAFFYQIGLGVATVATVLAMLAVGTRASVAAPRASETFHLQCLSADQAVEVIRLELPPDASVSARTNSPLGIVKVGGSPGDINRVRSLLRRYDTPAESQCAVQIVVPKVVRVP